MSKQPVSCTPAEDIDEAADRMAQHHISRICVCEGDTLEGVISLSDIVQASREHGAETLSKVSEREARMAH